MPNIMTKIQEENLLILHALQIQYQITEIHSKAELTFDIEINVLICWQPTSKPFT